MRLPEAWLVVALASGVTLLPAFAQANDAAFAGCTGVGVPIAAGSTTPSPTPETCVPVGNEHIALEDEALSLVHKPGGAWTITARYRFRNHGEATDVDIGFPINMGANVESEPTAPIEDYSLKVDGKAAELLADLYVDTEEVDYGTANAAQRAAIGYDYHRILLHRVHFDAGQTRELEHRYVVGNSGVNVGHDWVSYLLRTGAFWKDQRIDHLAVTVDFGEPVDYCVVANFGGFVYDPERFRATLVIDGWVPDQDLTVSYLFSDDAVELRFTPYNETAFSDSSTWPYVYDDLEELLDAEAKHDDEAAAELRAELDSRMQVMSEELLRRGYHSLLLSYRAPAARFDWPELPSDACASFWYLNEDPNAWFLDRSPNPAFSPKQMAPFPRRLLELFAAELERRGLEP